MTSFSHSGKIVRGLSDFIPSAAEGLSYDITSNPHEFAAGAAAGIPKAVTDTFVYPVGMGLNIAGKLGNVAKIPGSKDLAKKSGKAMEDYEKFYQDKAGNIAEAVGSGKNTDERSQKALAAGLMLGSLTNPAGIAKKIPAVAKLAESTNPLLKGIHTGLDVAEGGAVGLGLQGVVKGQEALDPLFNAVAKNTDFINDAIKAGGKAGKQIAESHVGKAVAPIIKKGQAVLDPITKSNVARNIHATFINPKTLTQEFIDRSPENPNLFLNIQKKLGTYGPKIEDVGEGLGRKNISENVINSWVSGLTKPLNQRSLDEVFANSKITNNNSEINQVLNYALDNDPAKIKVAKQFIDLGNFDAVKGLSKDFEVKFGDWRKTLPDTLGDIQVNPEQAEALRFGLVTGSKVGKAKVDPVINKINLKNQLSTIQKDVNESKAKADLYNKNLQDEQISYQNKIKEASDLYKQKRIEFENQRPILDQTHKLNLNELKETEKALSQKDPDQINLLKTDIGDATNEYKAYKDSLKISPDQRKILKQDYLTKRKALAEFQKTNKEILEEGQTTLPGMKDDVGQKFIDLQTELEAAKANYQNAGKPTEADAAKLAELEARINDGKTKLKTYERVLTPQEQERLAGLQAKTAESEKALSDLKTGYEEFRNQHKTTLQELGGQKKEFSRNILPTKKQEAKSYQELVKQNELSQKGIQDQIKKIDDQSTDNLFKNVQNQVLKEKTQGSSTELVHTLNTQKLELQNQLDKLPETIRAQKFALSDELSQNIRELNKIQSGLNKPNPQELETLTNSIVAARENLARVQAEYSVRPTPQLEQQLLQYQDDANKAFSNLQGYKRTPTPEEASLLAQYQEKVQQSKNAIKTLESDFINQRDGITFNIQDIESKINEINTKPSTQTALEQWMTNGVKRDLLVQQEKMQEAIGNNNTKNLSEISGNIQKIAETARTKIEKLDISNDQKLKLLGNLDEFTDKATIASKFTKVFMFGQLEPYVGQMLQFISAAPGARDYVLNQLGKSADDIIKASKGFNEYKSAKHNLIDAALYQPNKRFTDAFKLESNFDTSLGVAAQANVNTDLLRNIVKKGGWETFKKVIGQAVDILGYGAAEGYKKTSLDIAMRNAYPITKIKAEMGGLKEGSKAFDDLFIQETHNFMELVGEKSGNLKYLYTDIGGKAKVGQNLEKAFNHMLGNIGGREFKEVANTLVGWPANAHKALLISGNNAGNAIAAIAKRGTSSAQDRKALLSFASDVLVNAALFGVRGAARFPTGQTENPLEGQSFAQVNKFTWPMFLVNKITEAIPMTDATRQTILEGALGSKANDGSGGFGIAFERQKTVPIPGQAIQGAGFDVFKSKLQGMGKTASGSFKDVGKAYEQGGAVRGTQAVLYGLLNTIVDTFISKDIKNLSVAKVENKIVDNKGQNLTANLGEPSPNDVSVAAALKDKPASYSVGMTGINNVAGVDSAVRSKLDKFTIQELNQMRKTPKETLVPLLKEIAEQSGLDIKTDEAKNLLEKAYEKTFEDKLTPKFFSSKYKKIQSDAKKIKAMDINNKDLQQIKRSISDDELINLVGMAMLAGNKGEKVGEALFHMGLLTKENKKEIFPKAKIFANQHKQEMTQEAQEYFDSFDEEEETPEE